MTDNGCLINVRAGRAKLKAHELTITNHAKILTCLGIHIQPGIRTDKLVDHRMFLDFTSHFYMGSPVRDRLKNSLGTERAGNAQDARTRANKYTHAHAHALVKKVST